MKLDCSLAVNFIKERSRMCDSFSCCIDGCPIYKANNTGTCRAFMDEHVNLCVKLVQEWSDAHPVKTYAEAFFEKFPEAVRHEDTGVPVCCRKNIFGNPSEECSRNMNCDRCWKEPYYNAEKENK